MGYQHYDDDDIISSGYKGIRNSSRSINRTTIVGGNSSINNRSRMGVTADRQRQVKSELDRKLALSAPTRELLEELAVACAKEQGPKSQETSFQYAFALSKSSEPSELRYAVTILDGLVAEGYEHQVDCMYGAATASYLLGDYDDARVRY